MRENVNDKTNNKEVFKAALFSDNPIAIIDIPLAEKIGIPASMVLQRINYWVKHNEAMNIQNDFQDGHWWMFNSIRGFESDLRIIKRSAISDALKMLEKWGVIVIGNYNSFSQDRTVWYRIDQDELMNLKKAIEKDGFDKETYHGKGLSQDELNKMVVNKKKRTGSNFNCPTDGQTVRKKDIHLPSNGQLVHETDASVHETDRLSGKRTSIYHETDNVTIDITTKNTDKEITNKEISNKEIQTDKLNYKSLLTRLNNLTDNQDIISCIYFYFKKYEDEMLIQHSKITNEKLLEVIKILEQPIDTYYGESICCKLVLYLMDNYLTKQPYQKVYCMDYNIYYFAKNIKEIYQLYNFDLFLKSEEILKEYETNSYLSKSS